METIPRFIYNEDYNESERKYAWGLACSVCDGADAGLVRNIVYNHYHSEAAEIGALYKHEYAKTYTARLSGLISLYVAELQGNK